MKKVLLSGYYGFNNAGDEAVLFSIINSLKKIDENIQVTVLSNSPEQTAKMYAVNAVNRWKSGEIYTAVRKSDLLISGGGSLLQDVTSKNGILYYLAVIFIARILRKPVFVYSQGIGPIKTGRNRKLTALLLNRTQGITVRDESSKEDLLSMGVKQNISVSADPVLGIDPHDISLEKGRELLQRASVVINEGKILGVSVRAWNTDPQNIKAIADACDKLGQKGWQVVFIPMHFPEDITAGREVMKDMKEKAFLLKENYSPLEALSIYKAVDMVLGMRLHSLIMAAVLEKPLTAISYDPKVNNFMKTIAAGEVLEIDSLESQKILDLVQNTWENRDGFIANIRAKMVELQESAVLPAKMVREILYLSNK
ncbi:MAG: polysaccharide pyruvyl transferase CsaB [Peptococcaceae bacterium]